MQNCTPFSVRNLSKERCTPAIVGQKASRYHRLLRIFVELAIGIGSSSGLAKFWSSAELATVRSFFELTVLISSKRATAYSGNQNDDAQKREGISFLQKTIRQFKYPRHSKTPSRYEFQFRLTVLSKLPVAKATIC